MGDVDIPKRVQRDSAASRNGEVSMALLLPSLIGTLTKDLFKPSKKLPPFEVAIFAG